MENSGFLPQPPPTCSTMFVPYLRQWRNIKRIYETSQKIVVPHLKNSTYSYRTLATRPALLQKITPCASYWTPAYLLNTFVVILSEPKCIDMKVEPELPCGIEDLPVSNEETLERIHEGRIWTCDKCRKDFTDSSSLFRHKKTEHEGKRWTCEKCRKVFKQPSGLHHHRKSYHEGQRWKYKECGKESKNSSSGAFSTITKKQNTTKMALTKC